MELYIISLIALVCFCAAIYSTYQCYEAKHRLCEIKSQYVISSTKEIELQAILRTLENENLKLRDRAIQAETHFFNVKELYNKIEKEKIEAVNSRAQFEKLYYESTNESEKQIALANQRVTESERRINDWEKQREQAFKDAREAMFETGKEVFNKEAEEVTKKTYEQLSKIAEKVGSLSTNVENHDKGINLLIKSMSSPTAVGQFSEIGLSNILKEYGLLEGQDFIIQYSIGAGDGSKRPDAVLFIRDNIFVIDSKASKFFLELAEAEGSGREQEVIDGIKRSMNNHLNSLASKGYKEAVIDEIKKSREINEIGNVQIVMFLCNEAHVNKIAEADPEFVSKAIAKNIVISGPTGLQGLLAFARYSIARQKQEENQEQIIAEIRNLLGSISTVIGYVAKVGSGIKSASKHYESLVASVNRTFIPKITKINKLGIDMPANKPLPSKLESFEIITHSQQIIESEAVNEDESNDNRLIELAVG